MGVNIITERRVGGTLVARAAAPRSSAGRRSRVAAWLAACRPRRPRVPSARPSSRPRGVRRCVSAAAVEVRLACGRETGGRSSTREAQPPRWIDCTGRTRPTRTCARWSRARGSRTARPRARGTRETPGAATRPLRDSWTFREIKNPRRRSGGRRAAASPRRTRGVFPGTTRSRRSRARCAWRTCCPGRSSSRPGKPRS